MEKKDKFHAAMGKLADSIGARDAGWDKVAISNNASVIVKRLSSDFELATTENLVEEFAAERFVMLPSVKMGNDRYMVMSYAAEADNVRKLLDDRIARYKRGEITSVFGSDVAVSYPHATMER